MVAIFTVERVEDPPERGGVLATGRLAGGSIGDGVTLRQESTGRTVRVLVMDFGTPADLSRKLYTVVLDRREATWVEPGMELTVED